MKICDLAQTMDPTDANEFQKLWETRWLKTSQNALFCLWSRYDATFNLESLLGTTCGKCRARTIGRIGGLIAELNKIHNE